METRIFIRRNLALQCGRVMFLSCILVLLTSSRSLAQYWVPLGPDDYNRPVPGEAQQPSIAVNGNGDVYIAFYDVENNYALTVRKYNGTVWHNIGGIVSQSPYVWFGARIECNSSGVPFVLFHDAARDYKTTMMRYDGTNWITVGAPGFSPTSVGLCDFTFTSSDEPVVIFQDGNINAVRVMKYQNGSWMNFGPVINVLGNSGLDVPRIALNTSDIPYVACRDESSTRLTVWKYSNSTWSSVGGGPVSTSAAHHPDIVIGPDDHPMVVYGDQDAGGKATVQKYDGSDWSIVGNPGFTSNTAVSTTIDVEISGAPVVLSDVYISYGKYGVTMMTYNGSNWVTIGGNVIGNSSYNNGPSFMAMDGGGVPYAVFADGATTNVRKLDISSWKPVGSEAFSSGKADFLDLAVTASTPYVVYRDNDRKATVQRYDGSAWVTEGGTGVTPGNISFTNIAVTNIGDRYISYGSTPDGGCFWIRKFNGTSWPLYNSLADCGNYATLAVSNANPASPYLGLRDMYYSWKPSVVKYPGGVIQFVGPRGFTSSWALYPDLALNASGEPYICFQDGSNASKISVMRYDGTTWIPVGNPGFSIGEARWPRLAISPGGEPYVSFIDVPNGRKATVMKYDGSNWIAVGSTGFSPGPVTFMKIALNSSGTPYVVFADEANARKATVMKYNGSQWTFVGCPGISASQTGNLDYNNPEYLDIGFTDTDEPIIVYSSGGAFAWKYGTAPGVQPTLATGSITASNPICPGVTIDVPYIASGTYSSTNRFLVQLSSVSGNFDTPIIIGSHPGTISGTAQATIPENIVYGTAYRIRVVSTNPMVVASDNGSDIPIGDITPPIAVTKNITIELSANGTAILTPDQIDNGSTDNCNIKSLTLAGRTGVVCGTAYLWDYLYLKAPDGAVFSDIDFASFGTPEGTCGSYSYGACHAGKSLTVVESYVLGKKEAWIPVDESEFEYLGPCYDNLRLTVQARCTWTEFVAYDCSHLGTNTITLKATDLSGNTGTNTAIVTVEDHSVPSLAGPAEIEVDNQPESCGAVVHIPIWQGDDVIYATHWRSGTIYRFDKSTLAELGTTTIHNPDVNGAITRTHGLTVNPVTGEWYAVIGCDGSTPGEIIRYLVSINPITGQCTLRGLTGINVSGIAFDNAGVLYAIGGSSGLGANKLFTLNLSNGQTTYVMDISPGGGKGFGYNHDDGKFYHKWRDGFEKIDVVQHTRTTIPLTGNAPGDVTSIAYEGNGNFLANNISWYRLSIDGFGTELGQGPDWMKGLALISNPNTIRVLDNCSVSVAQTSGLPSGGSFPVGTTTNTYLATDVSGNTSTYSVNITVVDIEPPLVHCKDKYVTLDANGQGSITTEDVDDGSTDNCGIVSLTVAPSAFDCDDVGNNTVTFTATDIHGNSAACESTVEIRDDLPPVITVPSSTIELSSQPNKYETFTIADLISSWTDNCTSSPEVSISEVRCDEPDDCGPANRLYDILIAADCQSVQLRKERCDNGDGRVYRVFVTAKDEYENASTVSRLVVVRKGTSADEGSPVHTEYGLCSTPNSIAESRTPVGLFLSQNYPNPFNPSTTISYGIPESGLVLIRVFDVHGRLVSELVNEVKQAGSYSIDFDGSKIPSGIYLYRLESAGQVKTATMTLVK